MRVRFLLPIPFIAEQRRGHLAMFITWRSQVRILPLLPFASLVKMVRQRIANPRFIGSSPIGSSNNSRQSNWIKHVATSLNLLTEKIWKIHYLKESLLSYSAKWILQNWVMQYLSQLFHVDMIFQQISVIQLLKYNVKLAILRTKVQPFDLNVVLPEK